MKYLDALRRDGPFTIASILDPIQKVEYIALHHQEYALTQMRTLLDMNNNSFVDIASFNGASTIATFLDPTKKVEYIPHHHQEELLTRIQRLPNGLCVLTNRSI